MERVYIALTRHMATRRTPAPEDNHEEVQDRFRFKMFLMAFVEDLIYDWHPWATRQVKGMRKSPFSPPTRGFSVVELSIIVSSHATAQHKWLTHTPTDGLKRAIGAGQNVPQSFENAELSLDRLEDTILPQGDNRRSGRGPLPKKKPVPPQCPPGFEIDAQGVQRPKRKPVPSPSPASVPGAFPRGPDDPVPPPCPTPPPAVLNGQPNPAVAMGMGYNGAPPTPPETVHSGQTGGVFQSGMELMQMAKQQMGMGRGAPS